jgi:exosome complex component CSL4
VVDGVPLLHGDDITGVIRSQDIRATDKDKIKLAECFRGGDVVRGVVVSVCVLARLAREVLSRDQISLGDARSYYVSTARNDLGVIYATSEAGIVVFIYIRLCI